LDWQFCATGCSTSIASSQALSSISALWLGITAAYLALTALLAQTAAAQLPVFVAVAFTLAVALIIQPARTRLEGIANRWVFSNRLSGFELVRRLGNSLEQAPNSDQLAERLAATVRQGLAASWVRVWVRGASGEERLIASNGLDPGTKAHPAYTSEMVHAGETMGHLECGSKRRGDAYDARDAELLNTLGRQAALALRNAHLADELAQRLDELARQRDELAASRMRLVNAEEAGWRRIERDIHDGVQQQLVALVAKTRLARNQLGRDPVRAGVTLAELQDDARQALQDLRELAQGIHPTVLDDHGLVNALESRLARIPLNVRFEWTGITSSTRFAEAVEAAAYFLVSEALANTLKYAAAHQGCVHLSRADGQLAIAVSDDGCGFDTAHVTRRGLSGMADRIAALGGTLQVQSGPGQGTRVTATLPAPEIARD
jgi:signal transduction histidine kinase